jgi:2-hydroxycyclohexanecarboxyl-CoA dehydrogenase
MSGRVAFVTGGGGGIGAAICRRLTEAGHKVAVADVVEARAQEVAGEIGGLGVELDVTDAGSVAAAAAGTAEALGPVEICVNCAGWDELRPFLDTDEDFQSKVIEINYAGPVRVTRAVLPGMVEGSYGRIVNIGSDAGRVGSSLESVYSGAKGGVIAFTKTIAREFARYGITANTVCPGPTDTPLLGEIVKASADADRVIAGMTKAVPMRRLGQPDDVAPAVAFLASDEAGYITGQTLSVSGGLTMA